ncbi:IclR family transcriptional regulator [Cryobacterium sp. TMT1-66-1]|uniref:IclR family transcriptional regulator n=2 Tax=unclassified Cryobacterium TaxID=2649013 RepID=UPI001F54801D|nr:IclR family transcriptional regulator C-terminal domain-containing protein [Cryobacterium sp. TMT1-66-1]
MVSSTSDGYDVGPATARLSFKVQERLNIVNVAAPELEKLQNKIGFDTYLAVRTGNDVIYASRFQGQQRINVHIPLGLPLYRHATAAGKLFAALNREIRQDLMNGPLQRLTPQTRVDKQSLMRELDWIRIERMSISREEAVLGIIGLAAPIQRNGSIVGAIHVSALRSILSDQSLHEVSAELRRSASAIEKNLFSTVPSAEKDRRQQAAIVHT